jgi:hypothetical protein
MSYRTRHRNRAGTFAGGTPQRAIIDIGSNTVRLVVYGGTMRAPMVLLNEKVTAKLGREIAVTGRLAEEAMALALRGLKRFACWRFFSALVHCGHRSCWLSDWTRPPRTRKTAGCFLQR